VNRAGRDRLQLWREETLGYQMSEKFPRKSVMDTNRHGQTRNVRERYALSWPRRNESDVE